MKVKRESEVTQSYLIQGDPMDCSLSGSSIHGIFQARVLEWVPLPSPLTLTYFIQKCLVELVKKLNKNKLIDSATNLLYFYSDEDSSFAVAYKIP